MSLASEYSDSQDQSFINTVQIAICAAAVAISSEVNTTTNHANRCALAKAVLAGPSSHAPLFAASLASQGINKASTDTAINNGVASVWDAHAGVV